MNGPWKNQGARLDHGKGEFGQVHVEGLKPGTVLSQGEVAADSLHHDAGIKQLPAASQSVLAASATHGQD